MELMIRLYAAWPFRPHCSATRHVWLCELLKAQTPGRNCRRGGSQP
jgi:hypothetical protein